MKPSSLMLLVVTLLLAVYAAGARAQEHKDDFINPRHACLAGDLAGTYVLMKFQETPEGSETVAYTQHPYRYIAFYPDNYYATLSINMPVESAARLDNYLRPNVFLRYSPEKGGVLDLYIGKNIDRHYHCLAYSMDYDNFKKGDLVFTGYSKDGKNELFYWYRHWY